MSTQLGESPPFPCDPDRTSLSYQPFGANATTLPVGANICKVVGARIVGDYLTDNGTASLLVQAVDLKHPVQNSGGFMVFQDSFRHKNVTLSDTWHSMWSVDGGPGCEPAHAVGGGLELQVLNGTGLCGVTSRPFAGRTFAWARFTFSLTLSIPIVPPGSALEAGMSIPTAEAVALTQWRIPRHYLPLIPASNLKDQDTTPKVYSSVQQAGIWIRVQRNVDRMGAMGNATTTPVSVELRARRYHGHGSEMLASIAVPSGCLNGSESSKISLSLDPRNASFQIVCGSEGTDGTEIGSNVLGRSQILQSPSVFHGLDWQDKGGAGDTTGEAVIRLQAGAAGSELSSDTALGLERKTSYVSLARIARVAVTNTLPPGCGSGVLAPITDQSGITSWDIGWMGQWHDRGQAGAVNGWDAGADDGVLDVTRPPFNADPSGYNDSTLALQAAIDFGMNNYMTAWLPAGVYKVTQGLAAIQRPRMTANGTPFHNSKNRRHENLANSPGRHNSAIAGYGLLFHLLAFFLHSLLLAASSNQNNRFLVPNIKGQVIGDAGPGDALPRQGRATLWVPDSTPAFAGAPPAYPVAVVNASMVNHRGGLQSSILMSHVVHSIDVLIGKNNPGAIGFRMRGAQGSSLEDVAAFNPSGDAYAGIQGCSGSGGAHANLTVSGFRFGFDARETQPAPTASNIRIYNSSCAGLLHGGLETLSIAGLLAVAGPMTRGPAIVGAPTGSYTGAGGALPSAADSGGACPDELPAAVNHQTSKSWQQGNLGLSEGRIEGPWRRAGILQAGSSAFLRNVHVQGVLSTSSYVAVEVLNASGPGTASYSVPAPVGPGAWTSIDELAVGVDFYGGGSPCPGYTKMTMPTYLDGKKQPKGPVPAVYNISMDQPFSPSVEDLLGRHSWGSNAEYPGPWVNGAVHAKADAGAIGDGITDDADALDRAILLAQAPSGSGVVFLPRGTYRVGRSIHVPRGVSLAGIARQFVTITANNTNFHGPTSGQPPALDPGAPPAIILGGQPAGGAHLNIGHMAASGGATSDGRAISSPFTALFGLQVVIPLSTVNVSAIQWSLGRQTSRQNDGDTFTAPEQLIQSTKTQTDSRGLRGAHASATGVLSLAHVPVHVRAHRSRSAYTPTAYGNARQVWVTNVPTCGSWFFNQRCTDIFWGATGYAHAIVSVTAIDSAAATEQGNSADEVSTTTDLDELRWHAWYQEDGQRNSAPQHQHPLYRKMLVRSTGSHRVAFYQLNSEHCTCEAQSEFREVGNVEVYGVKSESLVTVLWVRDSTGFSSIGHGGLVNTHPASDNPPYPELGPNAVYRFSNSTGFALANAVDQTYFCKGGDSAIFEQPPSDSGVPLSNITTPAFEWPVYYGRQ